MDRFATRDFNRSPILNEYAPKLSMILSCPNCATSYTIDEAQLGPAGRTVRCAACKSTWHAQTPEDPIDLGLSPDPQPDAKTERIADLQGVKAKKVPLKYRAMIEDKKRGKALMAQGLVWGALAACILAVLAAGYLLRVDVVRAFPRIAGAYAMVGMKVNGTNLQFGQYTADAGFRGGRFVVTVRAQVRNLSDQPTPVPPVHVRLYDATLQQFDSEVMSSGGLVVGPYATRTLAFDIPDPKNLTSSLDLDFDLLAMKAMKTAKAYPAGVSDTRASVQKVADASEEMATPPPTVQIPAQQVSTNAVPALRGTSPIATGKNDPGHASADAPSDADITPAPAPKQDHS
jgi:predicted Zn finger-like uncharacterized protein